MFETRWSPGQREKMLAKKGGGRCWIRTSVGVSQQIYSLPPLATWVTYQPQRAHIKPRCPSLVNPHTLP